MNTITIEKGKVAFYSSLTTDTLVVNGVLKVNSDLKVRRLLGKGIVDARHLEAETVNLRTGDRQRYLRGTVRNHLQGPPNPLRPELYPGA